MKGNSDYSFERVSGKTAGGKKGSPQRAAFIMAMGPQKKGAVRSFNRAGGGSRRFLAENTRKAVFQR